MNIKIKHRFSGVVLYATNVDDSDQQAIRTALELATRGADLRDANLRGADLRDANLRDANLRDANLGGADLGGADLGGADLGGADLRDANLRDANLGDANLGGADLGGANLRDANLGDANLRDANLGGADLGGADLGGADLGGADLRDANLGGADLANAKNLPPGTVVADPPTPYVRKVAPEDRAARALRYRERHPDVPVVDQLDARILARIEANPACFDMGTWHCGTTHCRAGHAIDIAGAPGYELEGRLGSHQAGRLIYLVSTGRAPYFFGDNDPALEDIRRCAAEQALAKGEPPGAES